MDGKGFMRYGMPADDLERTLRTIAANKRVESDAVIRRTVSCYIVARAG